MYYLDFLILKYWFQGCNFHITPNQLHCCSCLKFSTSKGDMQNNFNPLNGQKKSASLIWHVLDILIVLADRFGGGYVVTMKIKAEKAGMPPDLIPAESFMESSFPGCIQREKHYNTLQYEIAAASLARVFQLVLTNKERLNIEDYSVSQTTLDQVTSSSSHNQLRCVKLQATNLLHFNPYQLLF